MSIPDRSTTIIRTARVEDAPALSVLWRRLLEYEASLNGAMGVLNPWAGGPDEILKQMQRPDTLFIIADTGGALAGYIKVVLVGRRLGRSEIGLARWAAGAVEGAARSLANFLLRRPRPNVALSGGYISGIWVCPEHRRRDLGRQLVGAAEEWLRSNGIATADLHVLFANSTARGFWEKLGYAPLSLGMQKKI